MCIGERSKIYGLAGLRVGWRAAPAWIGDASIRVRGPFDVSSMATAAAIASLADTATIERPGQENAVRRASLRTTPATAGVAPTGVANFPTVPLHEAPAPTAAPIPPVVIAPPPPAFGSPSHHPPTTPSAPALCLPPPFCTRWRRPRSAPAWSAWC